MKKHEINAHKRKLVLSLDYDDCLMPNKRALKESGQGDALDKIDEKTRETIVDKHFAPINLNKWQNLLQFNNFELIQYIASIALNYDEIIICCGSNRQNPVIDMNNACQEHLFSGSCYEGLEIFQKAIEEATNMKVTLDRTLLVDFFQKRKPGETFNEAMKWLKFGGVADKNLFAECPSDRSKIALHYLFMHKIASENSDAKIDYLAVDDRFQGFISETPDIIDCLNHVYEKNSHLLPFGTTLMTLPYRNSELLLNQQKTIVSTGTGVDANYFETTLQMMVDSLYEELGEDKDYLLKLNATCNTWNLFSRPEKLKQFNDYINKNVNPAKNVTNDKIADSKIVEKPEYQGEEFRQWLSVSTKSLRVEFGNITTAQYWNMIDDEEKARVYSSYKPKITEVKNILPFFDKDDYKSLPTPFKQYLSVHAEAERKLWCCDNVVEYWNQIDPETRDKWRLVFEEYSNSNVLNTEPF